MPVCAVPNCQNRSRCFLQKENIKLYQFPQEPDVQQKWLEACGRKEGDIKLRKAAICEMHFTPDCFENKLTQPRSQHVEPRMIRRLKKGSLPTLYLILGKKDRREFWVVGHKNVKQQEKVPWTFTQLL
ncbi:PREDICTED: THAP domain-containing protein 1-like [Vollenhovia emeryi]|uniref:THAP domain-containing protein 1-like n=1 Tax=Vollenhovia emeryi TaxID=411798 RepID=UPI0005F39B92|nr:PREDICTED: THAP domain-containing protein 1-like [Vollenhovia emeryi]